jgi:hypothetical protein
LKEQEKWPGKHGHFCFLGLWIPGLQRVTIAREDARKRAYGAALRPG